MIPGRTALLCALAAVPMWAQQQDPVAFIHGIVKEIGLGGLAAAQVTAYEFAGPERQKTAVATTVTDGSGGFHFELARFGDYWIEVKKEAYFASVAISGSSTSLVSQKPPAAETGTLVTVSAAHPSQEVRLALMRFGGLKGTVVDEDDKPLAKVLVEASMAGAPTLSQATAITDKEGTFTLPPLMPGDYVVKLSAAGAKMIQPLAKVSEDDLKKVDEDLETLYWPSAPDEASASPIRVNPAAEASLGTVHLRKTPSYRIRLSMRDCKQDNLPSLTILTPDGSFGVLMNRMPTMLPFGATVPSCDDLLVPGLKPGSYTFLLTTKNEWAEEQVEIGNKNREVTLALNTVSEITGRVVMDRDDVPLPNLAKARIELKPSDARHLGRPAMAPDAKGGFGAKNLVGTAFRVNVTGLGEQYCVKEIRVDGGAARDGEVRLYQGSKMDVVLDDQPATITGSVADGGDAFSQPLIFMVKWPSLLEAIPQPVTGDNDGHFQIGGLEPGEYRLLAVPSTALPDGEQVKLTMLGRLWADAERVTLERGASKTVALKLSDALP